MDMFGAQTKTVLWASSCGVSVDVDTAGADGIFRQAPPGRLPSVISHPRVCAVKECLDPQITQMTRECRQARNGLFGQA